MKKFLFLFLFVAAVASAFTFVVAADEDMEGKKFVIHGEVRERADYTNNLTDFTKEFSDSSLIYPYRARIGAEGHFSKDIVGYVEFQSFGHWGDQIPNRSGGTGPVGGNNDTFSQFPFGPSNNFGQDVQNGTFNSVELYEAYIGLNHVRGSKLSLRFGRQEIVKGTEMLLGDNDFYNGISHDGILGSWAGDKFALDIWMTRPAQSSGVSVFGPAVGDHQSVNFYGAWADFGKFKDQANVSAYALYYEDGVDAITPARRAFWTLGGRTGHMVTGKNGFNWNAELAWQTGDQQDPAGALGDNLSIKATGFEGMLGYNLHGGGYDQQFQVTYARASGDKDAGGLVSTPDKDAKSFDPLFQDSHGRYGFADLFTFSDLIAVSAGYHILRKDHTFGGDVWSFKLAEKVDFGAPLGEDDDLGKELDLWWKYQYTKNTQVTVAAAYFKPGNFIDDILSPTNTDKGLRLVGNLRLRF